MARTVTFDVLAVAKGVGFDELGHKISGIARDSRLNVSNMVAAITAVGPALLPVGAAIAGFGAGLTGLAAAGAVAFLGLSEQWKAGTLQATALGQQITRLQTNFQGLKATTATAIAPGLTAGLKAINTLTVPLGFAFEKLAGQLGRIAGNVAPALVTIFLKMMPLFTGIGDQLVRGSAAFLRWAQTGTGVTKFVEYAQANLPKVEKILGELAKAIGRLSQGLLPLGGLSLSTIGIFAQLVNKIPVPILKDLAPIIAGIILAVKAWRVAQIALDIVLTANPIGVVVVALAALAAAFAIAWRRSETFRNIVERAFIAVAQIGIDQARVIYQGFVSPFLTGLADILAALGHLPAGMGAPFKKAAQEIRGFRDNVTGMIDSAQHKLDSLKARVDISAATSNVAKLRIAIAGLQDKTVSVTTYLQTLNLGTSQAVTHDSHRAFGGPVTSGMPYVVGERGPELFVPASSGTIVPNAGAGHPAGGNTIHLTVNVTNPDPRAVIKVIERWAGGGGTIAGVTR